MHVLPKLFNFSNVEIKLKITFVLYFAMQSWKVHLYCCLMCSDAMWSCIDVSAKHSVYVIIDISLGNKSLNLADSNLR